MVRSLADRTFQPRFEAPKHLLHEAHGAPLVEAPLVDDAWAVLTAPVDPWGEGGSIPAYQPTISAEFRKFMQILYRSLKILKQSEIFREIPEFFH